MPRIKQDATGIVTRDFAVTGALRRFPHRCILDQYRKRLFLAKGLRVW